MDGLIHASIFLFAFRGWISGFQEKIIVLWNHTHDFGLCPNKRVPPRKFEKGGGVEFEYARDAPRLHLR
jgi:hypothetical protein